MVKILSFQCTGYRFNPQSGNSDPACCRSWPPPKKCNHLKERLGVLQEHQLWGLPKTRLCCPACCPRGAVVIDGNQVIKDGKQVNHVRD